MHTKNSVSYRSDIDWLRAISIIFVILFHAFPNHFKSGFIGVDIFFVISWYLITAIILRSLKDWQFSYLDFYKRRIKRIFPALIIVLLFCLLTGMGILFSQEYLLLSKHLMGASGFVSNIVYYFESGYFDVSSSSKPLLHLWSLGVEIQFYILWSFLLVFFYTRYKRILSVILVLLGGSLFLNLYIGYRDSAAAFYLPVTRLWQFMAGSGIAYIHCFYWDIQNLLLSKFGVKFSQNKKNIFLDLIPFFGCILVVVSFLIIDQDNFYRGYNIFLVLGISLLILSHQNTFINKYVLSNKILVYIGLISYPLYLYHWPLLSFSKSIEIIYPAFYVKILLIILSFLLSWITYKFIERPIQSSKSSRIPTVLSIILLLIFFFSFFVYKNHGLDFRFPIQEKMLKTRIDYPSKFVDKKNKTCENIKNELQLKTYLDCFASWNSKQKIFILGDSRSRAIWTAYQESLVDKGYSVISLGVPGCSLLYMEKITKYPYCNESLKKVINFVISQDTKGVVFSNFYIWHNWDYFEKSMSEFLWFFPKDIPFIWILQTPTDLSFRVLNVLRKTLFIADISNESFLISKTKFIKNLSKYNIIIDRLRWQYSQLVTVNPVDVLCYTKTCPIVLNKEFLYRDDAFHISLAWSRVLWERLPIAHFFPNLKSDKE